LIQLNVRTYVLYALLILVTVILQISIVPLIRVMEVAPSIPLIGIALISLREGPTPAMLYGFPAGLLIDGYAGEVVGISSLALTIAGFAMSFFRDPEKSALLIRSGKAVTIVLFGAVIYSIVYALAYFRTLDVDIAAIVLRHVIGTSVYTAVVSTIPVLILARTGSRLRV